MDTLNHVIYLHSFDTVLSRISPNQNRSQLHKQIQIRQTVLDIVSLEEISDSVSLSSL